MGLCSFDFTTKDEYCQFTRFHHRLNHIVTLIFHTKLIVFVKIFPLILVFLECDFGECVKTWSRNLVIALLFGRVRYIDAQGGPVLSGQIRMAIFDEKYIQFQFFYVKNIYREPELSRTAEISVRRFFFLCRVGVLFADASFPIPPVVFVPMTMTWLI